jgi:hypothetical protein
MTNFMAWRFSRCRTDMNFPETKTQDEDKKLAPPPTLATRKEKCLHRLHQHLLTVAEADELAMA